MLGREMSEIAEFTDSGESHGTPERELLGAILETLLRDATAAWRQTPTPPGSSPKMVREAFEDLVECGPQTRWLCVLAGYDPEWISAGFVRWCEGT